MILQRVNWIGLLLAFRNILLDALSTVFPRLWTFWFVILFPLHFHISNTRSIHSFATCRYSINERRFWHLLCATFATILRLFLIRWYIFFLWVFGLKFLRFRNLNFSSIMAVYYLKYLQVPDLFIICQLAEASNQVHLPICLIHHGWMISST